MKLQHLAVVFVIIMLPISLVLARYTDVNIGVIQSQASYNDVLLNATYDAVRAYQLNTLSNGYSAINDSKVRDVSASVNSFFNGLASGLGVSGYKREDLQGYIPAILFTMYDGYYLYGDYQNIVSLENGKQVYSEKNSKELTSSNAIKPFIYYSCEYTYGSNLDIIINYTLDNYITIMGTYSNGGKKQVINRGGYLINPNNVSVNDSNKTVNAHGLTIEPEMLGENIVAVDVKKGGTTDSGTNYYRYVYFNNEKYYYDSYNVGNDLSELDGFSGIYFFRLSNNQRTYIKESEANLLANYLGLNNYKDIKITNDPQTDNFKDYSAYKYYKEAKEFSELVQNILAGKELVIKSEYYNNQVNYTNSEGQPIHSRADYLTKDIFKLSKDNDPEKEDSTFNEHRMDVIISSVESNLMSIIANFNIHQNAGYQYSLPVLTEDDWYKIANQVTIVTFMQGMPIGNYKYYSNYAIITNTKNKEFVSRDSIFLTAGNGGVEDSSSFYHNPRCRDIPPREKFIGYKSIDYEKQTISYDRNASGANVDTQVRYYYPHTGKASYECIIGKEALVFETDNLIDGTTTYIYKNGEVVEEITPNQNVRKAYITALAREKYQLYKIGDYFNELS